MQLKQYFLTQVRLTHYLLLFTILFFMISLFLPKIDLQGAALTLFSVNSFLYGFYISPIIGAQRVRIDKMHQLVATEINELESLVQYSYRMEPDFQTDVITAIEKYKIKAAKGGRKAGNEEFASLVSLIVNYKGDQKDPHKEMLKVVFAAQKDRSEIDLLIDKKVFSNEWTITAILFIITISFILLTKIPELPFLQLIPAVLCAGLSMLIITLIKMSTLTHKRAKAIWEPFKKA